MLVPDKVAWHGLRTIVYHVLPVIKNAPMLGVFSDHGIERRTLVVAFAATWMELGHCTESFQCLPKANLRNNDAFHTISS